MLRHQRSGGIAGGWVWSQRISRLFAQSAASQTSKISLGTQWSLARTFSKEDVRAFAELSGDKNPVHLDEEAAAKSMFKKPIAHGMLGASLFSNLLGNNIPGAIYLKQNLKFTKPVYIGEGVQAIIEVVETVPAKKRVTLSTKLVKSNGEVAIEGDAFIWVNNDAIVVE